MGEEDESHRSAGFVMLKYYLERQLYRSGHFRFGSKARAPVGQRIGLFVVCLRQIGMTEIRGIVYLSGFSEDSDRQTKWEQSSRWGFWGTRGK